MEEGETADPKEKEERRGSVSDAVQNTVTEWLEALVEIQDNLLRLPFLAVLLPTEHDKKAWDIFKELSKQGVGIEIAAHTSYLNRPRTLWVLDWETLERDDAITPAHYLNRLVHLISEETQSIRPNYGPWMWPLHDGDVCSSIALSEMMDPKSQCWRKVAWALRLVPPEHGSVLERCLLEHYGRETGYVFAWANLFTRGMWCLALPMLIYGVVNVGPAKAGVDSIPWYSLQLLTIAWGICLTIFGSSRRSVLRSGAGLRRPVKAEQMALTPEDDDKDTTAKTVQGTTLEVQDLSLPHQVNSESLPVASRPEGADSTGAAGVAAVTGATTAVLPTASAKKKIRDAKLVPKHIMEVKVQHHKIDKSRLQELFVESGPESKQKEAKEMPDYRINPEYVPEDAPWRRVTWATLVTVCSLTAFLSLAALVLSLLLQLKSYLIFEWGECIRRQCDNAGEKWGFSAVLVDIAVDILMALVFVVGLGEACKALSFQLARLWNFKKMRRRIHVQTLISLCIEVMAKVGLFALLAFSFLPSWSEVSVNGSTELPEVVCKGNIDYDLCRAVGSCDASGDPYCCSGTLSCARQLLPFSARRSLFENWLVGPFVVAPFVDFIPAVLAPLLTEHLADLADAGATRRCGKCCCFFCGWLARFLAFIFVLDGEVTGIRYVCLGSTFGRPTPFHTDAQDDEGQGEAVDYLAGALDQAVLRPFDAMEELKELKLNFFFVLLFAPLKPILVLPTLLARLIEVRAKLQKLFMVKRRNIPRDARLVHRPQEFFAVFAVTSSCFWHIGLATTAYNDRLYEWHTGSLAAVWLGGGVVAAVLVFVLYRLTDKGD
ncbi:unnamed protein product [Durusdinium trenchii]|uniref:Anoctamin transmembrane domain-containing protein n=1 Tax=Durusdinium trenchii TaxID=1381693 RepID=A0ABP0SSA1_9DINO